MSDVASICESVAAVLVASVWGGVWLTNKVHERDNPPEPDPKAEERDILERQRNFVMTRRNSWAQGPHLGPLQERLKKIAEHDAEIVRIDEKLIELARRQ